MKTVFLHGLGQTAKDWDETIKRVSGLEADCPEVFSLAKTDLTYSQIIKGLERKYANDTEPFCICGISLGAMLALDYAIRHGKQVDSLVLIAVQYKSPSALIDFQNIVFRCMPQKVFESMGLSKNNVIKLTRSMQTLDFSPHLKEIACPVDIVCGEKDTANLKAAKKLGELLPKAKLHIIPGAGHEVNKCAPEAIAELLS